MRSPMLGLTGALVALFGLFLSAGATDNELFLAGVVCFGIGVLLNLWLILRYERSNSEPETEAAPAE